MSQDSETSGGLFGEAKVPNATGPLGDGDYLVGPGECVESIAYDFGLLWTTVWDDPRNSKLKKIRKNPNLLLIGDRLHVRPPEEKLESCATAAHHKFQRRGVPCRLKLFVKREGEPRADEPYELLVDGDRRTGSTNGEGLLDEPISPGAKSVTLTFNNGQEKYDLLVRHLDPVTEPTGIQQRLKNLGFDPGPIDGIVGPLTRGATAKFQANAGGLDVDGIPGPKTQAKLREVYGE